MEERTCDRHPEATFSGRKCRECNREYQAKWYSENKSKHIERAKKSNEKLRDKKRRYAYDYLSKNSCVSCGESDPIVLHFDHTNTLSKVDAVSKITGNSKYGIKDLIAEINKCQVLCANCHARKTARDFNWYAWLDE